VGECGIAQDAQYQRQGSAARCHLALGR
jgi:hypothetical protein